MIHIPFRQVIDDYARLEPGEADTWNPLGDDVELRHRTELFELLTHAVRASGVDTADLRVLDIGCGTGRSSRMYLDLGLDPAQVTGIDLRPGALARARRSHPGIEYIEYDGAALPQGDGALGWVSLCTVLSSVRAVAAREHLAAEIERVLAPGGHLFFWDLLRANDFAGSDALVAEELFPGLRTVWDRRVTIDGFRSRDFGRWRAFLGGRRATHRAVLLER